MEGQYSEPVQALHPHDHTPDEQRLLVEVGQRVLRVLEADNPLEDVALVGMALAINQCRRNQLDKPTPVPKGLLARTVLRIANNPDNLFPRTSIDEAGRKITMLAQKDLLVVQKRKGRRSPTVAVSKKGKALLNEIRQLSGEP